MSTFLSCGVAETVRAHRNTLLAEAERERLAARLPHRRGWWSAARTALDSLSAAGHRGHAAS
jgi:hypothetical protein